MRIYSIVLVFAIGVTLAGLFVLIVFGGPLGEAIAGTPPRRRLGLDLEHRALAARVLRRAALLRARLLPRRRTSTSAAGSGSLRARSSGAVLWLALSGLFSLYTSFSSSYDKTYGSLAGGIILLLWLNYSAMALLFGAELNAELDRQADIHASGGPRAGLIGYARRNR